MSNEDKSEKPQARTERIPSSLVFDKVVPIAIGAMVLILAVVIVLAVFGLVSSLG